MAKSVYQILLELKGQKDATKGINELGKAATLSGAALTAFASLTAKAAADYEFALAKVGTISDATTGSTDDLNQAFNQLSTDLDGNIGKLEAAQASYDIASAGFKDQTEILEILTASQKAAIGGFSDLGTITSAVTTILNAYGNQLGENLTIGERTALVTDQILAVQNEGVVVADQYARQIGNIAATAAVAGVDLAELNAVIATATNRGVRARQTFTGLQQTLSSIAKPTKQAREEAARLGIEFNQSALESKGLVGLLADITNAGGATAESLFKLFGSVEAVRTIAPSVGASLATLEENLNKMNTATGTADEAYQKMADTVSVRAEAALKTLNNTLIDLGQGLLVTLTPAIQALQFLVENFNALPGPIKSTIGIFIAVTGVTLTLSGAVLLLSTSYTTLTAQYTAAIPIITSLTAATTAKATAMTTAAASAAGLQLALVPLATTLGLVATAIGAAALAWKHYENIAEEARLNGIIAAQKETEILAQRATTLGLRMQETGEAIPEDEYQAWMRLLKETNEETGQLDGIITALERTQAKYRDTVDMSTLSNESNVISEEDRAKALKDIIAATQDSISAIEERTRVQIAAQENTAGSTEQRIQNELELERTATSEKIQLLEELLRNNELTEEQRQNLTTQRAGLEVDATNREVETRNRLEQLSLERSRTINETRIAQIEALAEAEEITQVEAIRRVNDARAEQIRFELQLLDTQLGRIDQESAQAAEIVAQKQALNNELVAQAAALEKAITAEQEKALQERLNNQRNAIQLTLQELQGASTQVQLFADSFRNVENFNAGIETSLSRIGTLLENENLSNRDRNTLLKASRQILKEFTDLGTEVNRNLTIEEQIQQALAQSELRKLDFKRAQLDLSRQQLAIEQDIKALELTGEAQALQTELQSGTLDNQEEARARTELGVINQKLDLLDQETRVRERGLDLQREQLDLERSIAAVSANLDLQEQDLPRLRRANQSRAGGRGGDIEAPTTGTSKELLSSSKKTEQTIRTTSDAALTQLRSINTEQTQATAQTQQQTTAARQSLSVLQKISTDVAALRFNTGTMINQLNDVKSILNVLPSRIASSLPRPQPAPRAR